MDKDRVLLSMGGGGRLSSELIEKVFLAHYGNDILNSRDDSAELNISGLRLAFTTDSYTIKPVFFPGGDIGKLSICGTVNDLSVKGAKPVAVSAGFIIEEGFPLEYLKKIACSMQETSAELGIKIVTGDTKVVSRGEADGVFINTSGIGIIPDSMDIHSTGARPGDKIILSGTIADHGIAIMNAREQLGFTPEILSDVAPVSAMIEHVMPWAKNIHVMRDPTRGGVASALNEIASASRVNMTIEESCIPVNQNVRSCCELLGLDPLYVANEGKVVFIVEPDMADEVLKSLRSLSCGSNAVIIGQVEESDFQEEIPPVALLTSLGTKRFIPLLEGDPLPRIC